MLAVTTELEDPDALAHVVELEQESSRRYTYLGSSRGRPEMADGPEKTCSKYMVRLRRLFHFPFC